MFELIKSHLKYSYRTLTPFENFTAAVLDLMNTSHMQSGTSGNCDNNLQVRTPPENICTPGECTVYQQYTGLKSPREHLHVLLEPLPWNKSMNSVAGKV